MNADPRRAIADAPMRRMQIVAVALCIALNALDGFDVLAISFAAPGIATEWGIDRARLGIVLSIELIGMAIGSVLIGNVADRVGRRPIILSCLAVMGMGMTAAAFAGDVVSLSGARLLTGLGIGGMLSTTSAMVAEFSNDRQRGLNVSLNIAGYSAGAILGGLLASALLERTGDWRSVFVLGAIATCAALPLAWRLLPESIDSILARRPHDALDRVNRTLRRLGVPAIDALPPAPPSTSPPSLARLFDPPLRTATVLLTGAYFAQILFFYYLQKWTPKIVVDLGFTPAEAARVLVCANIGNLAGAVAIGLLSQRRSPLALVAGSMLLGVVAILAYGAAGADLLWLSITAALAAFFINAGVVGLYPILAQTYPAALRASGTGFVIGMGRGGSALGPIVAGALFASDASVMTVSAAMGLSGAFAAAMIFLFASKYRSSLQGS